MTDRRDMLLVELENLQTQRRNAVEAYMSTGDRNHWREVREVSQTISDKLRELDEARRPAAKGDSLDQAIEELMVAEQCPTQGITEPPLLARGQTWRNGDEST